MKEILLYESSILVVALLFAFAAWSLYGKEAVEYFGPDLKDSPLLGKELIEKKRRLGMMAEMFRAIELALISTVIYIACTSGNTEAISLSKLFQDKRILIVLLSASSLTIGWCVFWGPRKLMNEQMKDAHFWDSKVWKEIRLPYLMWIPYLIGVYYLMGGFIVAVLGTCATQEIKVLSEASAYFKPIQGMDIENIQLATLQLNEFGRMISSYSQKYVMVSILALTFVVIEQHSYMEKTQFLVSLDIMKLGVVLLLVGTLGISLGYLPMIYSDVHKEVQCTLDEFVDKLENPEGLSATLTTLSDTQEQLESHDFRWLFISTISGYANILTLTVIGGSLIIRKAFFDHIPISIITRLVLPDFIIKLLERTTGMLGIQYSMETPATPKVDGE